MTLWWSNHRRYPSSTSIRNLTRVAADHCQASLDQFRIEVDRRAAGNTQTADCLPVFSEAPNPIEHIRQFCFPFTSELAGVGLLQRSLQIIDVLVGLGSLRLNFVGKALALTPQEPGGQAAFLLRLVHKGTDFYGQGGGLFQRSHLIYCPPTARNVGD